MIAWALTISLEIGDRRETGACTVSRRIMKRNKIAFALAISLETGLEHISYRSLSPQSRKPNGGTTLVF